MTLSDLEMQGIDSQTSYFFILPSHTMLAQLSPIYVATKKGFNSNFQKLRGTNVLRSVAGSFTGKNRDRELDSKEPLWKSWSSCRRLSAAIPAWHTITKHLSSRKTNHLSQGSDPSLPCPALLQRNQSPNVIKKNNSQCRISECFCSSSKH